MATLTEVGYYMRRIIKYGSVGLAILIISPIIWRGLKTVYLRLNPPPPPPPTVSYGKIAKPIFPKINPDYKPHYQMQTVDGKWPTLTKIVKVYVVDVNKSRLLQLDHIKNQAKVLGFVGEPEKIDDQIYRFTHPMAPAILTVNIIYNQYHYKLDWTQDQALFAANQVPNNNQAFLQAKNFWQSLGLLGSDLANGNAKYSYFSAQPPNLIPTISLSESNFIRVDMYRSALNELPFVTPSAVTSPVYVIFSGSPERNKSVIEAAYLYSNVLTESFSTYPLKGVLAAWEELVRGDGFIAHTAGNEVVVRNAYLAYYESDSPQEFVQPVYVFEGDNGFVAYVTAIDANYLQ